MKIWPSKLTRFPLNSQDFNFTAVTSSPATCYLVVHCSKLERDTGSEYECTITLCRTKVLDILKVRIEPSQTRVKLCTSIPHIQYCPDATYNAHAFQTPLHAKPNAFAYASKCVRTQGRTHACPNTFAPW